MRSSPQNDVSCPREIHYPGKRRRGAVAQQFELHPSGRRVYLSFVERNKCPVGPMTRDRAFGAKEQLLSVGPKHQPCEISYERA